MNRKLPFDAFDYYVSLGTDRSYQAVADHYGVTKRAVAKHAMKEDWQGQVATIERQVRETVNKKSQETLEQMAERHLKQLRVIQMKALEALKAMPLERAMEAVRALDLTMKQERNLRGDPAADREAMTTEAIIKREYQRWLKVVDDDGDDKD